MAGDTRLLTVEERTTLAQFREHTTIDGQRAAALLALDEGMSQSEAAELTGLTVGQVKYARAKFGKVGLAAFAELAAQQEAAAGTQVTEAVAKAVADEEEDGRLEALVAELDGLLGELKNTLPEENKSPYSPLSLLIMIRENISALTPDVQLGMLESFKDMTIEDLKDIETWKGMAYMLNYSAKFQANQMKDKMNEQMPDPLKPDTLIGLLKQGIDRFTPELAKSLYQNFQGTSKEDWADPETWKGMWYLINYSLKFQADQLKQRMLGETQDSP